LALAALVLVVLALMTATQLILYLLTSLLLTGFTFISGEPVIFSSVEYICSDQDLNPYSCEKCEMRFITRQELDAHTSWCTTQPNVDTLSVVPNMAGMIEVRFPCVQCGKIFRQKRNLNQHVRLECGKDPQFQCPHCPFASKLKQNRTKHILRRHPNK